jgi:hypothetical protein
MESWRVCRPMVVDLSHFVGGQNQYPGLHLCEKSDPHQNKMIDSDTGPHFSDADTQHVFNTVPVGRMLQILVKQL